jgi:cell division protein ZapA
MAEVVVTVNGRAFELGCADGQEARIRQLAQFVDGKIGELIRAAGQAGESRLLLMAALVIADELSEIHDGLTRRGIHSRNIPSEALGAAVSGIHELAERIEGIAARLESA